METIFQMAKDLDKLEGMKLDLYAAMYGVKGKRKFIFFKESDRDFKNRI